MPLLYTFVSVLLVSLASFSGVLALSFSAVKLRPLVFILISLSVGALFGDVFIHLIPEIFGRTESTIYSSFLVLSGILFFFILEKFLRWHHHHEDSGPSKKSIGYLNVTADGVHNFLDGAFIAAAYLISIPAGVATTVAVLLHELPQEIGDYGVLLHSGFSPKEAVLWNAASATFAFLGAILVVSIGSQVIVFSNVLLAFTAGSFIYIAGSDLVPELQANRDPKVSAIQLLSILAGIFLMSLLIFVE